MKCWKKTLICILVGALVGCFVYVHRRVIRALITGEPMPEAPAWHFWCKK